MTLIGQTAFLVTPYWKVLIHSLAKGCASLTATHQNLNRALKKQLVFQFQLFSICQILHKKSTEINRKNQVLGRVSIPHLSHELKF